ncbi:MAG: hypothetical protein AYL33_005750 [Candidatus Bathyarchaeota archaeon B63]|nr:MAG: hypothetical protein AYL33_005750 [Candidatus Bathyarchaeota archaeon B63]
MQMIKRILKKLKWRSGSSAKIIACPRCGSTRITLSSGMDAWLTPKKYVCQSCGYVGPIIVEIEREELEHPRD